MDPPYAQLFCYSLPYECIVRVLDLFLREGWKTIHRVGLAVLELWEPHLLSLEVEETR